MLEDEEDESAMSAVRYQVMPSLVALQLMRNRLHMAYLGRKLMKWSAIATNRELRQVALALDSIYKSFGEEFRHAYMLLARGRYFCPIMNKMVLENAEPQASVSVTSNQKSVAGCKLRQYSVVESGMEPYEHLGIEKGGQQIHEAKVAWLELIKRLILIQELRLNFATLETAYLNANKKKNMLSKIIIPRIGATMTYITSEMEEQAREETFRLKRVKQNKTKLAEKENKKDKPTGLCNIPEREYKEDNIKTVSPVPSQNLSKTLQNLSETTIVAPQETNDDDVDKQRLEILLKHVNEIIKTLAARPSKNTDKMLESCNMFKDFASSTLLKPKDSTPSTASLNVDSAKYAGDSDYFCKNMQEKDMKPMNAIGETASEFHQHCVAGPCLVCSPEEKSFFGIAAEKTPTESDYHKKYIKEPQKDRSKSFDTCPTCGKKAEIKETKKSPSNVCACQGSKGHISIAISIATDQARRDAATSTTNLEVVPNRPQNKCSWENTGMPIKIIAKPEGRDGESSRTRFSRQNFDEHFYDTHSSMCKRCSKTATKKAVSKSNICSKCQRSLERKDSKASRSKCPLCGKEKEIQKPSCPCCHDADSYDSSMSEYQGGVSLSSDKCKCILAGQERKDEAQVWKDAATSTTDLEVVPSKPQSKSVLKNTGMPIKIFAEPSPSRNRSSRQNFDENYSDTNGYVCKRCSKNATKKAVSESNICSKCQTSLERRDSKASRSKCLLCGKEKEIQKPSSPYCHDADSNDSSMSEYQGRVSLSSDKSKSILAGKERKDEAQSSSSSLSDVISYLKMKIFGADVKDEKPCECCGVNKTEEKHKVDCTRCKKELSLSNSDSLSNCCRKQTETSKSRTSTVGTTTGQIYSGTQTYTPTLKRSCKFDNVVKVAHISDSVKDIEEEKIFEQEAVCKVCSRSSNTKDIGVNTKPADRFDVRPLSMLLRPNRPKDCTVCQSERVFKSIYWPVRKARSCNL